jgi:hypothetical protein
MAKMKSWKKSPYLLIEAICQLLKGGCRLIQLSISFVIKLLIPLWELICRDKPFAIVFFVTVTLVVTLFFFGILPMTQNFEGKLLINGVSFTSSNSDQLFLKDISGIKKISIAGKQKLTLAAPFSSKSHPDLDRINDGELLEIELPNEDSQWSIAPSPEFTLQELRLQKNTRIADLKYATSDRRRWLSFSLQPDMQSDPSKSPVLKLDPGGNLSQVSLSGGYRVKNPKLSSDDASLEFSWRSTELELHLTEKIEIDLYLSEKSKQEPFWGNIYVKDVKFDRVSQNVQQENFDKLLDSTILSGEIRMAKQEIKLEEDQFLSI